MGNSCECPRPPGGRVNCGPDQLAICRVRDGEVRGECIDPPASYLKQPRIHTLSRNNWVLSIITGIKRAPRQALSDKDEMTLSSGRYRNPRSGEIVTFSLPWEKPLIYNPPPTSKLPPPMANL